MSYVVIVDTTCRSALAVHQCALAARGNCEGVPTSKQARFCPGHERERAGLCSRLDCDQARAPGTGFCGGHAGLRFEASRVAAGEVQHSRRRGIPFGDPDARVAHGQLMTMPRPQQAAGAEAAPPTPGAQVARARAAAPLVRQHAPVVAVLGACGVIKAFGVLRRGEENPEDVLAVVRAAAQAGDWGGLPRTLIDNNATAYHRYLRTDESCRQKAGPEVREAWRGTRFAADTGRFRVLLVGALNQSGSEDGAEREDGAAQLAALAECNPFHPAYEGVLWQPVPLPASVARLDRHPAALELMGRQHQDRCQPFATSLGELAAVLPASHSLRRVGLAPGTWLQGTIEVGAVRWVGALRPLVNMELAECSFAKLARLGALRSCTPDNAAWQLHWTAEFSNVQAAGVVADLMERSAAQWRVAPVGLPPAPQVEGGGGPLDDAQLAALLEGAAMPTDPGLRRQLKAFLRRQRAKQWVVLRDSLRSRRTVAHCGVKRLFPGGVEEEGGQAALLPRQRLATTCQRQVPVTLEA